MNKLLPLTNRYFYPECYIPEKLLNIFEGNIKELSEKNRPTFIEQEPIPPKVPEEPHFSETVKALLIPSFIGLFFHFTTFTVIIFVLLIIAAFHYVRAKDLYPNLLKKYNSELTYYEATKNSYLQNVELFNKQVEKYNTDLHSHRFINSLIVKALEETFKSSPKSNVCVQSPKKGRSEFTFQKYLVQYFGDTIHQDCSIEIFQYSKKFEYDFDYPSYEGDNNYIDTTNSYVPDFCFIHPTKSLKIDIEIDEPYTYKKPIHYFGSDNRRNQYFVDKNWIVMRFSEQQVLTAPNECCREISEIIHDFTNDASYINKLLHFNRLTRVKKWGLDDANKFITINHRQCYPKLENQMVGIEFINSLWEDEEISYEFVGINVKKILKNKHWVEKAWKKSNGTFYLTKDKLKRYCVNILWDTNLNEYLIIDSLVKGSLTITNMYTRAICRLISTISYENIHFSLFHDESSKDIFSIDEIKKIFNYEKLPLKRLSNKEGKTTYLHYLDEEKGLELLIHQNLVDKINNDKSYNKIGIAKPNFSKFNEKNRIRIELIDTCEENLK